MPSASKVLRQCLIDLGLVTMPDDNITADQLNSRWQIERTGALPCYVRMMPDEIEQCVCIVGSIGHKFGKAQPGGIPLQHYGVKLIIRAADEEIGDPIVKAVAGAVDSIYNRAVTVEGVKYTVASAYVLGTPIEVGEEPGKRRQLWSINARVAPS